MRGGQAHGIPRYLCERKKAGKRLYCWHGTNPIGLEKVRTAGIPRARADRLIAKLKEDRRGGRRYVITAAQNATPVNSNFFGSLLRYCAVNKAQLLVIPYRYKNPTSLWSKKAEHDDWWAPELAPYLIDKRTELNRHLVLMADIKTQPTADRPLQGFETITGAKSGIIGHPKLELTTIATPQARLPKILTTTGTVTRSNYIPGKAGKKGEHHHTFGATVVEISGDTFHLRQINAVRDGSFMDLRRRYTAAAGATDIGQISALVMGDSHIEFIDPLVAGATFGRNGILATLRPKNLVWHDVNDFYARAHHDRDDTFINYAKHHFGRNNVERELDAAFKFIDRHTPLKTTSIIVRSNHSHDFLERWVKEANPKLDPENAVFWARTFEAMCLGSEMSENGAKTIDPFKFWAERKMTTFKRARFLTDDESCVIEGIEVGLHGHRGINGSRGTRAQFGRIGVKTIIGHSHSPGIYDGTYQVGTSSLLRLAYNHGPSSWLNTHAIIYPNGKRTLISVIDGRWKA